MSTRLDARGKWTDVIVYPGEAGVAGPQFLTGLDDHDLNDLEFALAQRKAMSKRCPETSGRHACALAPDHDKAAATAAHQCRGCDRTWTARQAARN